MKKITRNEFLRWVKNLTDANLLTCLTWFGYGQTWGDCFEYLSESWDRDEIAGAFMK